MAPKVIAYTTDHYHGQTCSALVANIYVYLSVFNEVIMKWRGLKQR